MTNSVPLGGKTSGDRQKTGGRLLPKGYKLAKGGKRLGAGRLTREVAEAKKLGGAEEGLGFAARDFAKHIVEFVEGRRDLLLLTHG